MKRIFAIIMSVALLASCGSQAGTEKSVSQKKEIDFSFSGIDGLGNDPNNINQNDNCMAFDDNYIYYTSDDGICKIAYDGNEYENISQNTGAEHMNVYDGSIYYSIGDGIYKVNTETGDEETVFEMTGDNINHRYSVDNMFIYDGFLFYTLIDSGRTDNTQIGAIELGADNERIIFSENGIHETFFSTDGENIYAFERPDNSTSETKRNVLKLSLNDLKTSSTQMSVAASSVNVGGHRIMLLDPKGMCTIGSIQYGRYLYERINGDSESWGISEDCFTSPEGVSDEVGIIQSGCMRYVLGNNMILLARTVNRQNKYFEDKKINILCYKDMDLTMPEITAVITEDEFTPDEEYCIGVHDNKLYLIREDQTDTMYEISEDGSCEIITIAK